MSYSPDGLHEQVLTWIVSYGTPFLGVTLFLCALGIPIPGTLFVIAAGAFMRLGVIDVMLTPVAALTGAVLGDVMSFGIGRSMGALIHKRFGEHPKWLRARSAFRRHGGFIVFLTRWLLTPLAIPINLLAGSGGYPMRKFLLFDVVGEMTWLLIFGGLGYIFGSQWEAISQLSLDFSG